MNGIRQTSILMIQDKANHEILKIWSPVSISTFLFDHFLASSSQNNGLVVVFDASQWKLCFGRPLTMM